MTATMASILLFATIAPNVEAIKRVPEVEAKDHPEVVHVSSRSAQRGELGKSCGVLLASNIVLTAAHGVARFDAWEVTAPYTKHGPATVTVKAARVHPEFKNDPIPNDIAILVLSKDIDIGRDFPAFHDGELLPIDTKLMVVGRVSNGRLSMSRLYKALTAIVPFPGNTNVYGGHPQVVEEGDSGGPVFMVGKETTLVGLVSGNLGAGRANVRTDAFTPVSRRNHAWIVRQIRAAAQPEK